MSFRAQLKTIPDSSGVYLMRDKAGNILYIGKAASLKKRVGSYFHSGHRSATNFFLNSVAELNYLVTPSSREALILENRLIKQFKPRYNVAWRDDKSYPYLKLTLSEDFPRLLVTRRRKNGRDRYFGPYPDGLHLRRNLKIIKRIFPLRNCRRMPGRVCLDYHIERCLGPCAGKITKEDYDAVAKKVEFFLNGRYQDLLAGLEKEMRQEAERLNFEKARQIRNEISFLNNLVEKIRLKEIKEEDLLRKMEGMETIFALQKKLGLPTAPLRIEAFDISNLSGKMAVGSLVSFLNGEYDKDNYRRFRIKSVPGIDDYAMLKEVLFRRYARLVREGRKLPDLILVDGGKGQLGIAQEVLASLKMNVPVAALAKEEETVYLSGRNGPLRLDKSSGELLFLMKVRDEAHRFALTYHRHRRIKNY